MMLRNFDDITLFVMPILNRYIMFGRGIFRKYPSQYDIHLYLFNYTEYYLEDWLNK